MNKVLYSQFLFCYSIAFGNGAGSGAFVVASRKRKMPTYEYLCEGCGHAYEVFEGIKSRSNAKCPKCKKAKAKRVISGGSGIIFKGSGFYSTDYRSGKYKESAKKES